MRSVHDKKEALTLYFQTEEGQGLRNQSTIMVSALIFQKRK